MRDFRLPSPHCLGVDEYKEAVRIGQHHGINCPSVGRAGQFVGEIPEKTVFHICINSGLINMARHRMNIAQCLSFLVCAMIYISSAVANPIIVVGKDFTEQGILAEMTSQLLKNRGLDVEKIHGLTTSELHDHMRDKKGDIYWQYTTTRLMLTYGDATNYDKQAGYEKVKQLDIGAGYTWLKPTRVNNTYALAMRKQQAEELGIASISDLFAVVKNGTNLRVGVNDEFASRPDGLLPLERTYGGHIRRSMIAQIDTDYVYQALRIFGIDVGIVFATDGRIRGYNFVILNDDQDFFFNYILVPVVKTDTVEANPSIVEALNELSTKLDNATMMKLNAEADIGKRLMRDVAAEFLRNNGLLH